MFTDIEKFIHVIAAIAFFGITFVTYCAVLFSSKKYQGVAIAWQQRFDSLILLLFFLLLATGSLLVYPKGFNYHTPWIVAAYLLLGLSFILFLGLMWCRQKIVNKKNIFYSFVYHINHLILVIALFLIIHDAVTKQTYF